MGTREDAAAGYAAADLDGWAERARAWAAGGARTTSETPRAAGGRAPPRDVFLYVISGAKERNPAAAMALIERLG